MAKKKDFIYDSEEKYDILYDNIFSNAHGGSSKTADQFISGYGKVFYLDFSQKLAELLSPPNNTPDKIARFLTGNTLSFTPHSESLEKHTAQGAGTARSIKVSGNTLSDSITTRHRAYQGLPGVRLFRDYTRVIRRPDTGGCEIEGARKEDQCCTICYVILRPDWVTIERAYVYTGCLPDKEHSELFDLDFQAKDGKEYDLTWSFDRVYDTFVPEQEQKVKEIVEKYMKVFSNHRNEYINGSWGAPRQSGKQSN